MNKELPNLPAGSAWRDQRHGDYVLKTAVSVIAGVEYEITGVTPCLVTPEGDVIPVTSMMARDIPLIIKIIEKHGRDPLTINREFLLQ